MAGLDITSLSKMLSEVEEAASSKAETGFSGESLGKSVGSSRVVTPGTLGSAQEEKPSKKTTKDIWDEEEVPTHDVIDDTDDGRRRPEYDILYKQAVGTEDVYFGMGEKDPSSRSCELMVVKIKLPSEKMADIDLDVKKQSIVVQSPQFKLATYLPHEVDPEGGKARWDASKHILSVDLPIKKSALYDL